MAGVKPVFVRESLFKCLALRGSKLKILKIRRVNICNYVLNFSLIGW